jgi:hypothetical protein
MKVLDWSINGLDCYLLSFLAILLGLLGLFISYNSINTSSLIYVGCYLFCFKVLHKS